MKSTSHLKGEGGGLFKIGWFNPLYYISNNALLPTIGEIAMANLIDNYIEIGTTNPVLADLLISLHANGGKDFMQTLMPCKPVDKARFWGVPHEMLIHKTTLTTEDDKVLLIVEGQSEIRIPETFLNRVYSTYNTDEDTFVYNTTLTAQGCYTEWVDGSIVEYGFVSKKDIEKETALFKKLDPLFDLKGWAETL